MKKIFIAILLVFCLAGSVSADFEDVAQDSSFFPDISYIDELGVVKGSKFLPDESMTRAEFAKWLLRNVEFTNEEYLPKTKRRFSDLKKRDASSSYVYRLVDLGVVPEPTKGSNFFPNKPLQRIEALEWIFKVEGVHVPPFIEDSEFQATDIKIHSKRAPLIHRGIQLGILDPGKARPFHALKRKEAARFLRRLDESAPTIRVRVQQTPDSDLEAQEQFRLLANTWDRIFSTYLNRDKVEKDQLVYAAIEGLIKELKDPNSEFSRPSESNVLQALQGQIEGIGAVLQLVDNEIVVVSPIAGSPAENAGLRPGDIIIKVDDQEVRGLSFAQAVSKIRGPKGTAVKISIRRTDREMSFLITRDTIVVRSTEFTRTQDNIGIIELQDFGANSDSEMRKIVEDIQKNPVKGIVLDLRNNPGGFLDKGVTIAGHWIAEGQRVVSIKYPDRVIKHNSGGKAELANVPTVVLINKGSASASEILAGALQDYKIAKIIGVKSFGKGTVQEVSEFANGSVLKLTVAAWLTPNGNEIDKNGITPDIEAVNSEADIDAGRDPQKERALFEVAKR